ncbi:MAG TPA: DUF2199 domain-containing protein [Candidatus Angelobacter sp.]
MPSEAIFDGFRCEICEQFHAGQYLSFASDCPGPYAALSNDDKKASAQFGSDQCVIDDNQYYIRGLIELPIIGLDEVFLWGAWARIWQKDYEELSLCWDTPGREKRIGPFKARLANNVLGYSPDTLNLKCTVHIQAVDVRPHFVMDEPDHPLAIDQRRGISLLHVRRIASLVRHKSQ